MSYTLYNRLGSGGFAAEAAMTLAGIPFKLELIDSKPSTALPHSFRAVNPWGQVPALVTAEGTLITETAAILIWLAARHDGLGPGPGSEAHGAFVRWLVFMGANLYEGVLRQTYPDRYVSDPAHVSDVVLAAADRNHAAFQVLEHALEGRDTLLGGPISAADIFLAMLTVWHRRNDELSNCSALAQKVAGHPTILPIWSRNFDARLDRTWGR